MNRYFFLDDFLLLLLDFFDEDPPLAAFFDAAMLLTTFHAVRDLPVALLGITRRIAPANSFREVGAGWRRDD
ncbi:MAG TPA: hypothetical protein VFN10_14215 [Thermoanaerobaculia bacterium]|nr:hypothetical protein [Thermoanaerobaculia bacterium]